MRPGVRDPNSTDGLHKAQKRIIKRLDALEAGGVANDGDAPLSALEARMEAMADASKRRDEALRDQIATLRGQVLALSNKVKRLKGDG